MANKRSSPLSRTIKFRLSEADYARLAQRAEGQHVRVNEFARQLATNPSMKPRVVTLDPALVMQLQDIGIRLQQIGADEACPLVLYKRIKGLCQLIAQVVDHAMAEERLSWFR